MILSLSLKTNAFAIVFGNSESIISGTWYVFPTTPNQQKQKLGFFTYIFCAPNSFFPNGITKLHLFHNLKKKIVSGQ